MSRDIFVQDILADVMEVKDIPIDWVPDPLPYSQSECRLRFPGVDCACLGSGH